jgi:hypothetical protein
VNNTVFPYPGGKASYADWIVSYGEPIPEPFQRPEWPIVSRETEYKTAAQPTIESREATEHLILSFDPSERRTFLGPQTRIESVAPAGGGADD